MEFIRGFQNLTQAHRNCVATIGNFDGVHLGHQAVINQLAEKGRSLGLPCTLITFEPQPQEYFRPDQVPARLTRLREKLEVLANLPVDRVLCLHFNAWLANLTAHDFVKTILVDGLNIKFLVVGDDFRFGKGRSGDFAFLHTVSAQFGFEVTDTRSFLLDDKRVSSTLVRNALASGELAQAAKLLGRQYYMCGRVAHGDKRGRSIGFPTANIYLHRRSSPLYGVYAVRFRCLHSHDSGAQIPSAPAETEVFNGVANLGQRPTFDGTRTILEVHILDFDRDIYGQYVEVTFLHKIREEQRFESFDALVAQINRDVEHARGFFAR